MNARPFQLRAAAVAAVLALQAGCLGDSGDLPPVTWEGELLPTAGATVMMTGEVFMVANPFQTEAIMVLDGSMEEELAWLIRTGRCTGTGTPIADLAAFGDFAMTADGPAASMSVPRRVNANADYAAELIAGTDEIGTVIACGDMRRTE